MTVALKHPSTGSVLNVSDNSVDVYVAAGWIKVEPAKDDDKPAKKTAAKKHHK
jgi:hypothetical protein